MYVVICCLPVVALSIRLRTVVLSFNLPIHSLRLWLHLGTLTFNLHEVFFGLYVAALTYGPCVAALRICRTWSCSPFWSVATLTFGLHVATPGLVYI